MKAAKKSYVRQWNPKSVGGKAVKIGLETYRDVGKSALNVGLLSKSAALKSGETAARHIGYQLRNKIRTAGRDDVSRSLARSSVLIGRGVRLARVSSQAKRMCVSAQSRQLQYQSEIKAGGKTQLKYKKRILKTNKKLLRSAKCATLKQGGIELGRSAFRKTTQASENNDFVKAAAGAVSVARAVQPPRTAIHSLHKQEKSLSKLTAKSKVKSGKLYVKQTKLTSKQTTAKAPVNNRRLRRKVKKKDGISAIVDSLLNPQKTLTTIGRIVFREVGGAIVTAIITVLLISVPILMLFSMCAPMLDGVSQRLLSTYLAEDSDMIAAYDYFRRQVADIIREEEPSSSSIDVLYFYNGVRVRRGEIINGYMLDPHLLIAYLSAWYFVFEGETDASQEHQGGVFVFRPNRNPIRTAQVRRLIDDFIDNLIEVERLRNTDTEHEIHVKFGDVERYIRNTYSGSEGEMMLAMFQIYTRTQGNRPDLFS